MGMVEDVKRAIWVHRCRQELGEPICDVNDIYESHDWEGTANEAIAAATPHIRQALFDELIEAYDQSHYPFPAYYSKDHYLGWLRSQKGDS